MTESDSWGASSPQRTGHTGVGHYENFPVASVLCPPRLRAPIVAIYHFARTADDLADEGCAPAHERLRDLEAYRQELLGAQGQSRWLAVFQPLALQRARFGLPDSLLLDLLDAFEQDVRWTASGKRYPDRAALLEYCRRSANPVGRLLLHLYGVSDALSLQRSDAICSALQLINFWQDLGKDIARERHYLPLADLARFGVVDADLRARQASAGLRQLLADLCHWARDLMLSGAPLAMTLPGRAGWELRLVVQGGLRILDRIEQQGFDTLAQRPVLRGWDYAVMLWRALRQSGAAPLTGRSGGRSSSGS